MISEEKQKALEAALGNIEKQFGKGSVMKLGDSSSHMQVEAVPTGCLSLDVSWRFTDRSPVVRQR